MFLLGIGVGDLIGMIGTLLFLMLPILLDDRDARRRRR